MENPQPKTPSDELEVVKMFGVDARCRIDLQGIVVVGRVLEKAVEWIKHLMREQEEEFSVGMLATNYANVLNAM
jgi:hypothetical protein